MPSTITTDQRQQLAAQAETIIERHRLQGATAWAYGIPQPTAPGPRCDAVIIVTATGGCHMTIGGRAVPSWRTGDPGAAPTVDDQLRMVQQAGWTHLFTLNACECEGDGRVWLDGLEQFDRRNATEAQLAADGILFDEGRLYRRCTCGAEGC